MTIRMLAAVALLLAVSACNRQATNNASEAGNSGNVANAAVAPAPAADNAATTPAPAAEAPTANATAPAEAEGEVRAGRERGPTPSPEQDAREGCAGEIGLAQARRLVRQCIQVSPGTRPPCNTANSCALIQSEIDRSCAMIEEDKPAFCKVE